MNSAILLSRRSPAVHRWAGRLTGARWAQALLLIGFWQLGDVLARVARLPIPGAIVGLFLVLGLLAIGRLPLRTVHRGATWFVGEMLLFFVPPVLAVLDHPEFAGWLGVKLLTAIVLGTAIVMTVTAVTIDLCYRWLTPSRLERRN